MYESTTGARCSVCGGPVNALNITGICRRNPDCDRKNAEAKRRRKGIKSWADRKRYCEEPGCGRPHLARGRCQMHYVRVRKTGDPGPAASKKTRAEIKAGDVIGVWTVLEGQEYYGAQIPCRCQCGNQRLLGAPFLLKGNTGTCICHQKGRPPGRPLAGHTGTPYLAAGSAFGRLTVLEDGALSMDHVRCRCDCGNETTPRAASLKVGNTRSCGCLQLEVRRTHGLSGHPLYGIWHGMIWRCTNPDTPQYLHYGGRGITVCERWLGLPDGLLNFAADVGERPPGTSLDRYPDNDGNYEPGNVRWATAEEQVRNRRTVAALELRLRAVTRSQRPRKRPARQPVPAQAVLF